jgi:hypothetical protein
MALSSTTFSNLGGAATDLFAGLAAGQKAKMQAEGQRISAEGTLINAQSTRITAESLRTKAQGDIAEAQNYDLAAGLATENAAFTNVSTRIQQSQALREETQTIGRQRAGVAGAGFAAGGSAYYLMRDSANQGALAQGTIGMQGAITAAGYTEQAAAATTMANAGRATAASEMDIAGKTDLIAGQQEGIAGQEMHLADETEAAAKTQEIGDFVGAAFKGAAAIASIVAAPATGGASLAATAGLDGLGAIH